MPVMNMLPGGSTLQIPLDAPTSFSATAGNAQVELTWTDPLDKYATPEGEVSETGDQLVSVWDHTVLVRKTGSQPAGPNDGTVVVSSSVRNQYQSTGYTDTGLTNDTTYYYGVFAYNKDGVPSPGAFSIATPKDFDPVLNNNNWDRISLASSLGIASSLWEVGDAKEIHLEGLVGTVNLNTDLCVFILGFDHNAAVEGSGITFGTFKTAISNGKDVCLVDSNYNNYPTNNTLWFNINRNTNSISGGWKGCDLRYFVLGSTDVNNGDATANCIASPLSGTLMAALPADMRAVLKPMTIYTDNVGNGTNAASNVTASVDYLPNLAEFEIFGTRVNANSEEQYYQEQYQYFKNGNSKLKYRYDTVNTAAAYWERSPWFGNNYTCCQVNSSGASGDYNVRVSFGLAPICRV